MQGKLNKTIRDDYQTITAVMARTDRELRAFVPGFRTLVLFRTPWARAYAMPADLNPEEAFQLLLTAVHSLGFADRMSRVLAGGEEASAPLAAAPTRGPKR